jgi:hypothetical protein
MVTVTSADLRGKLDNFGPVRFLRAEWWKEAPRFVLLRYAIRGQEQELGLRLDLDKQAILDSLDDDELDRMVSGHVREIWTVVVGERQRVLATRRQEH